jgi:nucleotide-binding universal stress UspA family protein
MADESPVSKDGESGEVDPAEVAVVLAAIDNSSLASRVVEYAARLARRTWVASQLHVLHVVRHARFDRPDKAGVHLDEVMAEARAYLDHHVRMARRQCPAPVTGHLAEGDPIDEILSRARTLGVDLLIVGTHDTSGLERLLTGSVAEKVAKRGPCPVLIVRPKQRPYTKVS